MMDLERDLREMMARKADGLERTARATPELVRRARFRRAGTAVFSMAAVVALLVGGLAATRSLLNDEATAPAGKGQVAPSHASHRFTPADLPRVVLSRDDAPPDAADYGFDTGKRVFGFNFTGEARSRIAALEGFEQARLQTFYDHPRHNDAESYGDLYVASWAVVFDDSNTAATALEFHITSVGGKHDRWDDLRRSNPGLGDEGAVFEGITKGAVRPGDEPVVYYVWRINNLLLGAWAAGEYDPHEIRSIANLMTTRAADR